MTEGAEPGRRHPTHWQPLPDAQVQGCSPLTYTRICTAAVAIAVIGLAAGFLVGFLVRVSGAWG